MRIKIKHYFRLFFSIILIAMLLLALFLYYTGHGKFKKDEIINIHTGDNIKHIASILHHEGLIQSPHLFDYYARLTSCANHIQAGEYKITKKMDEAQFLAHLINGAVIRHHIVFIEGWTFAQYKTALCQNPFVQHNICNKDESQIAKQLNLSLNACNKHSSSIRRHCLEGLFFPDTYSFTKHKSDLSILNRAYLRMQKRLTVEWKHRAKNLPYKKPYDALIVASMVQSEAKLNHERPIIAGIMLRRLKKHIQLEIDSSVVFGLRKHYGYHLDKKDLTINTPYNLYLHYRLPPTPISMPGKASISAALHPDHSNMLYYVARGDGSHQFSSTYKEQCLAIERYLKNKE